MVLIPQVGPAGSNAIHTHLHKEFSWHLQRLILVGYRAHICPVLKMVTIAALVVHPRQRIAILPALLLRRAKGALVIPSTTPEFRWRIFGKIVGKTPPVQSHLEAVLPHQVPVMGNGSKMSDGMHLLPPSLLYSVHYYNSTVKGLQTPMQNAIIKNTHAKKEFSP